MKDTDSRLLWETYVSENQQYFEKALSNIRASLEQGAKGIPLADVLRDEELATDQSKGPVKVTYAQLSRPYVKQLEDGSRVINFKKEPSYWNNTPDAIITQDAYGYSIQHALTHDSAVSSGADKVGSETSLPQVIDYVIINVEHDKDGSFARKIEQDQKMKAHAGANAYPKGSGLE